MHRALSFVQVKLEDAEQKKTVAEGIAENVSREKAIVEVETSKAQVQAEQVAKTQAEVSHQEATHSSNCCEFIVFMPRALSAAELARDVCILIQNYQCLSLSSTRSASSNGTPKRT